MDLKIHSLSVNGVFRSGVEMELYAIPGGGGSELFSGVSGFELCHVGGIFGVEVDLAGLAGPVDLTVHLVGVLLYEVVGCGGVGLGGVGGEVDGALVGGSAQVGDRVSFSVGELKRGPVSSVLGVVPLRSGAGGGDEEELGEGFVHFMKFIYLIRLLCRLII